MATVNDRQRKLKAGDRKDQGARYVVTINRRSRNAQSGRRSDEILDAVNVGVPVFPLAAGPFFHGLILLTKDGRITTIVESE